MSTETKKFKSGWFRVAVAGDTTDGREIAADWIKQMAASYNPTTYTARLNVEHMRSYMPDGMFGAYGDVLALKTEKVTVNGEEKDALYAQIQPNQQLVELNKRNQKIFTSIEVDTNFAKTGQAYLVGLAVTDSPASLGTEMLQFAAKAATNPLTDRKQRPENLFTAAHETEIEIREVKPTVIEQVKNLFKKAEPEPEQQPDQSEEAIIAIAEKTADIAEQYSQLQQSHDALKAAHDQLTAAFNELKTELASQPATAARPEATGSKYNEDIDC